MHRINRTRRNPAGAWKAAAVLAVLLLAALGLAACGSSGSSTTTSTSANAAATSGSGAGTATAPSGPTGSPSGSGPSGPTGPRSGRFTALRECLQKNGVTLPKPAPGQRRGFLGGATGLPNGVTRGQMEAALKKCGGLFGGGLRRFSNPGYKQSLAKFATCMRENGVDVPEPNTSGNGPVFNTKGLETNSVKFRTAEAKCRAVLRASFRPPAGGAGAGPTG
jgi:hypothetical protein